MPAVMVVTTLSAADDSETDRMLLLIAAGRLGPPLLVGDILIPDIGSEAASDEKENLDGDVDDEEED